MMNTPLTMTQMIKRAEMFFPKKEVVSRTETGIHTFTYKEIADRTRRLASSLEQLGVNRGDKVGTLAWNHHRHLEAYFAIPCSGAVLHTINIRLSPQHIVYIINHAEDRVLLIDPDLVPLIEKCQDQLKSVEAYVIMSDSMELPETTLSPVYNYEQLLENADANYQYPDDLDENSPAGMCYTSATTGNPKGVIYSHRGIVLHSMAIGMADSVGVSEQDIAMPIVPMFHVNAWGLPFAAVWFGTKLVMPGPYFTPKLIAELIQDEKITITAGVPTIWLGLLKELEENSYDMSSLRGLLCGGSAAPKGIIRAFEEKHKIPFIHAYGMTETSPLAVVANLKSYQKDLPYEEKLDYRAKQGVLVPGLEIKIVSEKGEVSWDGKEMGELCIRGPWIASEYYKDERTADAFQDGWLHTGDVVTIDEEGFVKIVDRTKDLIKSGGEWISSVDIENALMAHEAVFEAAVIGIPDERWQERPLAYIVLHEAYKDNTTKEELLNFLTPQFAKWWIPDDVQFITEIPKSSVGKFLKRELREQYNKQLTEK
ncbi:acyl-CoA synthetase (AMP-forming)/AMP-acid ligase II [Cytobacillus horneckiae]|nr:long-chain fatty acid--CoA ligase [Cytobacillus horneckiae]MBN6887665.1 long-chain fatty acid--CoA ligase [Cytobacillus horneckiae]MCM3178722.1 long-chain fatty acid--CoA ligase [Cytobacillus horneckiae]MEC1158198.1 long-chain fatty acid--CoA ligase [Cytobacillus horneckiae]MED2940158.1 long-chain fatty acid--CoA ligase [Cytobacillus horneckiae]